MTKFIFENKDKKAFKDCSGEEQLLIVNAKVGGEKCDRFCESSRWDATPGGLISVYSIYRVLAPEPIPNWIDWDQCPVWAKYCYTSASGRSWVADKKPPACGYGYVRAIAIDGFPFFKRGTVSPEDSLLVRPEGK